MKSLIKLVLTLAIGAFLGYVFHDKIDTKLKEKFGEETVEAASEWTKENGSKAGKVAEGAYNGAKEAVKDEQE